MSTTTQTPRVGHLPLVPAYAQTAMTLVTDPTTHRTLAIWGEVGAGGTRPGRVIGEASGQGPEAMVAAATAGAAWLAAAFS